MRELELIANEMEDRAAIIHRAAEDWTTVELMDDWVKRLRDISKTFKQGENNGD